MSLSLAALVPAIALGEMEYLNFFCHIFIPDILHDTQYLSQVSMMRNIYVWMIHNT